MKSRRGAREAAVQLLYASELVGLAPEEHADDFWLLREERERQRIRRSQARSALGQFDAIDARRRHLLKHQDSLEETLPGVDPENRLAGHYTALLAALGGVRESLARIEADLAHPGDAPRILLPESLENARTRLVTLGRQHDIWEDAVATRPGAVKLLEPVAGKLAKLRKSATDLGAILSPQQHPEHSSARPFLDRIESLHDDREVPQKWACEVYESLEQLDERLEAASDNFRVARIHPVDRAVLRLAAHELVLGEVPPPVVIDEAIEIARRFSTTESSSFLNGVLEQVRKSLDTDSTPPKPTN